MKQSLTVFASGLALALSLPSWAQETKQLPPHKVTVAGTIETIDSSMRLVNLKTAAGKSDTIYVHKSVVSASQVMSSLSPTLTLSNTDGSTMCRLYFQPFGPTKVIADASLSIESTVAVITRCSVIVPDVAVASLAVVPVSTAASPSGFSRTETLSLYVAVSLSPTLSSPNRSTLLGT